MRFDRIFNFKVYRVIFSCLQAMILCCIKCSVHGSVFGRIKILDQIHENVVMSRVSILAEARCW